MLASQAPEFVGDKTLVGTLCERLVRIYHEYGLGYPDTTYRGLLFADFLGGQRPPVPESTACHDPVGRHGPWRFKAQLPCGGQSLRRPYRRPA